MCDIAATVKGVGGCHVAKLSPQHPRRGKALIIDMSVAAKACAVEAFNTVLADLAFGRPVVVGNTVGCELVVAASAVAPVTTAFLIHHGSGFITVTMPADALDRLGIPPLTGLSENASQTPAFHVAVDAAEGVTTGISSADRARTIRLLADCSAQREDFSRPGHVIPVRVNLSGGPVHSSVEAASRLCGMATESTSAAMCALISVDHPTRIANMSEGRRFAARYGLSAIDVTQVNVGYYNHHQLDNDVEL
jgi:3,4-dihydroxy 2-butanone 4-phosphate synthase / GTP cyclohydrolase II